MSDWSYLLGNIHQALEALLSDAPQEERVKAACTHILKTPQAFMDSVLSATSKEALATITSQTEADGQPSQQKIDAIGSFIVSAIQDTAKRYRSMTDKE